MHKSLKFSLRFSLVLSAALLLSSCIPAVRPPEPIEGSGNIIAVLVTEQSATMKMISTKYSPGTVYFARLEDGSDALVPGDVFNANFRYGEYFLLLNAPPGRYVLVASKTSTGGKIRTDQVTYFSEEIMRRTEVNTSDGPVQFMGEVDEEFHITASGADEAQKYYASKVGPGLHGLGGNIAAVFTFRDTSNLATLISCNNSEEARGRFIASAKMALADTGWASVLDK